MKNDKRLNQLKTQVDSLSCEICVLRWDMRECRKFYTTAEINETLKEIERLKIAYKKTLSRYCKLLKALTSN